jgi:hypothetical protein
MKLERKLMLVVFLLGAMSAYSQSYTYTWSDVGLCSQKDFDTVVRNYKFNGMVRLETRRIPDKVSACIYDLIEKHLNKNSYLVQNSTFRIDVDEYIVVIRITKGGWTIDRIEYYWYLWVDRDIIHY